MPITINDTAALRVICPNFNCHYESLWSGYIAMHPEEGYMFCSKCGGEMTEAVKEAYQDFLTFKDIIYKELYENIEERYQDKLMDLYDLYIKRVLK